MHIDLNFRLNLLVLCKVFSFSVWEVRGGILNMNMFNINTVKMVWDCLDLNLGILFLSSYLKRQQSWFS